MIRIESVNPSLASEGAGERAMAEYVASACRGLGLEVRVEEASPGRPNVVAVMRGGAPSRDKNLLFNGHLDTVGLGGMKDPLVPTERDGRLYGRGALDMKGGLASILGAVEALVRSGIRLEGDVIFAATSDEEYASVGAAHAARSVDAGGAVVAEATGLGLCTAHKGFAWLKVRTVGRAAHGSLPAEGVDAIVKMGKFLSRLERYSEADLARRSHRLLGPPSVHASTIAGGTELSTYPAECTVMIERRTIPGETESGVVDEMQRILDEISAEDRQFGAQCGLEVYRPPYEVDPGERVCRCLSGAFRSVTGRDPHVVGVAAWLDSAVFASAGIPSVIFGPGGGGQHADEEYVNLEDVYTVSRVLAETAVLFSGGVGDLEGAGCP
jgi:acetylornithine deacetylase